MDPAVKKLISSVKFSFCFIAIIWIVHTYKFFSDVTFRKLGIFPREWDGFIGVFTAPLVHGDWEHLISNSLPLFVSLTIIHFFYKRVAISSFVLIYLITGMSVWFFGRSVYHIGASGVVYGLISFIFWSGVFRRNIKSIVLALIVTIAYADYLAGVVPFQEGVSWESHLLGVIVGIIIAFLLKGLIENDEIPTNPWSNDNGDELTYYLPRDTFIMTKDERACLEEE